jgi:hypothetical protein
MQRERAITELYDGRVVDGVASGAAQQRRMHLPRPQVSNSSDEPGVRFVPGRAGAQGRNLFRIASSRRWFASRHMAVLTLIQPDREPDR